MSKTNLDKLRQALAEIDRPGSFCASGSGAAVLPGLVVDGLGPIGLPLTATQAKELTAHCRQAPYGKGEETLVDTSVRRVWRLTPDLFSLTNPAWQPFLQETVVRVQEEFGLEKQKLKSHLHDLLLYESGSFFLSHRDGEKLERMIATLVIMLPSAYEGGELVVRHDGQQQTIDFSSAETSQFQNHFAAFYADCEHEVRPLRKGYRLCLVYNLTLAKSKKRLGAPRDAEHIQKIVPILREWSADDTPRKLAVTLDHEYTKGGLTWDALKGVDRAKARILGEAARQAGCHASLALLTLWQSGAAEGEYVGGYGRRGRWYSDYANEDEDAGDHEMGEIYDTSLTAKDWRDTEDHDLPIGELNVEDEEILDLESLTDVKPEEEFEGYTGNAGMTLDRWYRHAAVFLWPERRHFDILCDRDGRNVVPVLNRMVSRWKRSHPKDAALKQQCLDFAAAIMTRWRARDHAPVTDDKTLAADLLTALVALAEPKLIERFFGEVMMKDVTIEPGEAVVEVGEKFGWTTFERELLTVFKSTTRDSMERNVGLLEQLCLAKPRTVEGWRELCRSLARESIGAIVAVKSKVPSDEWRGRTVNRADLLAGLARSLLATDQVDLMEDLVAHALASRSNYPLTSAHVPALTQPAALAQDQRQTTLSATFALGCSVPRTIGIADRPGTTRAGRLSSRGRRRLHLFDLRCTQPLPG